jgi:hypothetical protein
VEEDVKEHQDTNTACVVGTGQKMDRAQDATLTNRGTRQSDGLHNTPAQVHLGRWEESSERGTSAQPRRVLGQAMQADCLYFFYTHHHQNNNLEECQSESLPVELHGGSRYFGRVGLSGFRVITTLDS